jgi:transcriptional regulator with XRE-family HTH domain
MTKKLEPTNTNTSAKGGAAMDLLEPRYSQGDQGRLEELRSRLNVARALLAARIAHGLSQEGLGKAAGTKQSRVSEIEAMKGNPRFDTLDRVSRAAGLMIALVPRAPLSIGLVMPAGYRQSPAVASVVVRATSSHGAKWAPASAPLAREDANG